MLNNARVHAESNECKIEREGESTIMREDKQDESFDAHQMIGRLKGFYETPRTVVSLESEERIMIKKKALRNRKRMISSSMLRLGLMAVTWGDLMPCWEGTFQSKG